MELSIERSKMSERMQQVRGMLSFIKSQESSIVPPTDSDIVKMLRGLFFVHLYGAFEKSINEAVEQYLQAVGNLKIRFVDFSVNFLPIALDAKFSSLQMGDKWQSRIDFSELLESTAESTISNSLFAMQLQNTRSQSLKNVALSIGASRTYAQDARDAHYLDEVVEKRNQVAHGRNNPLSVGSSGRSGDLEIRFDALNRTAEVFFGMLEDHFNTLQFVKQGSRVGYQR